MRIQSKFFQFLKNKLEKHNEVNKTLCLDKSIDISGSKILHQVTIGLKSKINNSIVGCNTHLGTKNYLNNVYIEGSFTSEESCKFSQCYLKGNISTGKFTSIWGPNIVLESGDQNIKIGNFCSIARGVSIQTFNHNYKKITSYFIGQNLFEENWENERVSKGDIIIENDVWIGANVVILGGVTIHNGAVVAANAVVTSDVPPFSIVAGTPAKVVGYRFDDVTIKEIQELRWWDWSIEKIKSNKKIFFDEFKLNNIEKND